MDSKEDPGAGGHLHNMATENSDTIAMQKKRARRVSFAETTSIRLFNRDEEEDETPMLETARIRDGSPGEFGFGRLSEPYMEFAGDDSDNENDEDEDMRRTFLRPDGSPSPGGSTFASASSNDEDNFFGPVSANFIRPGRLSDSAASDDNHDHTMDSTAFSMHFRSLARSESGVDRKTPTGAQLFSEEKTPTDANLGSSMIITLGKKPLPESFGPVTDFNASHTSNDMSIVGESDSKYDYDKLPPGLDAILTECGKDILHVSVSDDIVTSPSPKPKEAEFFSSIDHGDNNGYSSWITSPNDKTAPHIEVSAENDHAGISASVRSLEKNPCNAAASNRDNDRSIKSLYQFNKNGSETPLAPAFSPSKWQQIALTTVSPFKQRELVSPLTKPGSMLRNGSVEYQKTETSIQKSISKLESLERSAFSSAFSANLDNSFVKTLDFFRSPNADSLAGNSRHISRIYYDSVTEEKLPSVHKSKERNYPSSKDRTAGETLNHISDEIHVEKYLGQILGGELSNELKAKEISEDQIKYGETVSAPSKMTRSGRDLERSLFTSKHSDEDALMTETESLLAEITPGGKGILTPALVSSPDIRLSNKSSASPGPPSTQTTDLFLQDQFMSGLYTEDLSPGRNFSNANLSTEYANLDFEANEPKHLMEIPPPDNGADIYNEKETFGTTDYLSSPAKEKRTHEDKLPGRDLRRGSNDGSVSPSTRGDVDELKFRKISGTPASKTNKLSGILEKFEASKRNMELLLRDTQHRNEMASIQRSPKVQKVGNCYSEKIVDLDEGREALLVHERKKWTDIYYNFSEDMKSLFSGLADKLNSEMINALEDSLVYQKRSKVYEMLRDDVFYKNSPAALNDLQHEEMAETKSLLHHVVFEKAKLQLNHVKKERLLKRLQLLSSRLQESQQLRENIASQTLQTCKSVAVDAIGDRTMNLKKGREVCQEQLTAMRQTLDTLDKKVLNLTRTFHSRCKIKANPGCDDTISLVNKYLTERASCRLIRLEMQMYVIESVSSVSGQHNVVLNYLDLITQRIKILVGPASSVSTSFTLNETHIIKNFPSMDSCIAFAYVFNAKSAHKYIGSKTLPQETQLTSLLLGTLLDVVDEVQLAQMEFPNLTLLSFCSPSAEQLHLRLCFFNFPSGEKVNLTLDMSCLKSGIYPAEIVPLQLVSLGDNDKASSSQTIFDEITEAVKEVKPGYTRILRLCKCVSEVVRASTV